MTWPVQIGRFGTCLFSRLAATKRVAGSAYLAQVAAAICVQNTGNIPCSSYMADGHDGRYKPPGFLFSQHSGNLASVSPRCKWPRSELSFEAYVKAPLLQQLMEKLEAFH